MVLSHKAAHNTNGSSRFSSTRRLYLFWFISISSCFRMAESSVRDELNCSVCLNIFRDPVMLSCGHNFCRVCIGNVLDTQDGPGVYICPECRAEFAERPVLQQNRSLNNIAQHFLSTQPRERDDSTIPCSYCDTNVSAVRTCVHCEASLCITHLKKHSKSVEHVLIEPTSSLENRKCPVHKEILKYYCTQDDVCICTSCWVTGDHAGHQVEMLSEAAEKAKKKLREKYVTFSSETAVYDEEITRLQAHTRQTQDNATAGKQKVNEVFKDIRRRLKTLGTQAVSEINRVEKEDLENVSECIQEIRRSKTHLSSSMNYIQELCNMADPLAVVGGIKRAPWVLYSEEDHHTPNKVDEFLSSIILHVHLNGLNNLLADVRLNHGLNLQDATDILLDVNTAANDVAISEDRKAASYACKEIPRPDRPERFQCRQVMSNKGVSSGQHYWEVETLGDNCAVGLCYPTMDRRLFNAYPTIGKDNKSWSYSHIDCSNGVNHDDERTILDYFLPIERMGIFLDYEVGRISFYNLDGPIRHLHTFTAAFTEPLHLAVYVFGTIRIIS
uniref:Uncharacterized protein n=1 Tax=Leptobrachium leishanense TaxID=445787 RepID=A0A8C5PUE9_9ANUR